MVRMIRLKQLSPNTERTYLTWLRSYFRFVNAKPPEELNSTDVQDFLTHLAADRHVSPSTQNQAFNAILFFYRFILEPAVTPTRNGWMQAFTRREHLPEKC